MICIFLLNACKKCLMQHIVIMCIENYLHVRGKGYEDVKVKLLFFGLQDRLMKKLGPNAFPFTFTFPAASPCSVTLQPGESDEGKPLGVEYSVRTFVADNSEDKGHKRSSVALAIKKVLTL